MDYIHLTIALVVIFIMIATWKLEFTASHKKELRLTKPIKSRRITDWIEISIGGADYIHGKDGSVFIVSEPRRVCNRELYDDVFVCLNCGEVFDTGFEPDTDRCKL